MLFGKDRSAYSRCQTQSQLLVCFVGTTYSTVRTMIYTLVLALAPLYCWGKKKPQFLYERSCVRNSLAGKANILLLFMIVFGLFTCPICSLCTGTKICNAGQLSGNTETWIRDLQKFSHIKGQLSTAE